MLFTLFLNDMDTELNNYGMRGALINDINLLYILCTDDAVFSDAEDMQVALDS